MRVAVASDHAGFPQKAFVVKVLKDMGYEVLDLGPASDERVDYPDFAKQVAKHVAQNSCERGVLICGTGLGMAITADKKPGVRAVAIQTPGFAELARAHNDANVVCLSGRFVSEMTNAAILKVFMETPFAGGRHAERVKKIEEA